MDEKILESYSGCLLLFSIRPSFNFELCYSRSKLNPHIGLVKYYQKKRRIQWKWQAVDSKMVSAPLGGDLTGPNPTDRAKSGSKRHIWVDQRGAPLSIRVTAANDHDVTEIMNLINRPIVCRPKPVYKVQHLCADKAYDSEEIRTKLRKRNITPHIRKRDY